MRSGKSSAACISSRTTRTSCRPTTGRRGADSDVLAGGRGLLEGHAEQDIVYNRLIRPGESLVGLFNVVQRSLLTNVTLYWLTAVPSVSRRGVPAGADRLRSWRAAEPALIAQGRRLPRLMLMTRSSATEVVTSCQ